MAELFNSRWVKQDPHQLRHVSSISPRQSISDEAMDGKDQLESAVLMNILAVLTKMNSKMELQTQRLEKLELTSPSSSNGGSTLLNDSPITRGPSTRTSASKKTAVLPNDENELDEYVQSITKMDWDRHTDRSESFVGDSIQAPDVVPIHGESCDGQEGVQTARSNWGDLVSGHLQTEEDAYSIAMYTRDMMGSRMSLGFPLNPPSEAFPQPLRIPPSPPATEAESEVEEVEEIKEIEIQPEETAIGAEGPIEDPSNHKNTGTEIVGRQSVPKPEIRKRISISVLETRPDASYIKIEVSFHAPDVWKQGKERLRELHPADRFRNLVEQVVGSLRSASERRRQQRSSQPQKRGVKLFKWRIVISLGSVFQVNREQPHETVGC